MLIKFFFKEVDQITTQINKSKKEPDELINRFDTFEIDEKQFTDIKQSVSVLKGSFNRIIGAFWILCWHKGNILYVQLLLLSDYSFFKFIHFKAKSNSTFLKADLQNQLANLCEFSLDEESQLKYGATSAKTYIKCDGVKNILTVIKTTNGNVFGGFAEQAWNSKYVPVTDPNSFIFSLISKRRDL